MNILLLPYSDDVVNSSLISYLFGLRDVHVHDSWLDYKDRARSLELLNDQIRTNRLH
jgi:hypothetical protein